ncbi:MAG: hypothetical protein JNL01_13515 [Bdellovibrionales bacterium]|nr:hypothetical protein [Bdellovibrionales bacterium]
MRAILLPSLFMLLACSHLPAQARSSQTLQSVSISKVDADLRAYDSTVANMEATVAAPKANPKDMGWVKKKLKHMFDVDQYMRKQMNLPFEHSYNEAEKEYFSKEYSKRFKQVDNKNTEDLKGLLKIYRWFVTSKFGAEADNHAWTLVQHADEQPEFQKQVLAILTGLYKTKETSPKNYAYLFDRVAASFSDIGNRKLQRYGTQGQCTGPGKWAPIPMEEPSKVDQRRADVGLGSMAEYIAMFKNICHSN